MALNPLKKNIQVCLAELFLILPIAFLNDVLDWFGVDLFLFRSVDLITAFILGFWLFLKSGSFPTKRYLSTFVIEIIPFLGDITPSWSLFVLILFLKQNKEAPVSSKKSTKSK